MSKYESRKQFHDALGFEYTNERYSWSAVNHDTKQVMFSVWKHYNPHNWKEYLTLHPSWEKGISYRESLRYIDLVKNHGYEPCILVNEPTERFDYPRGNRPEQEVMIKKSLTSFYFTCTMREEDGAVYMKVKDRVNV